MALFRIDLEVPDEDADFVSKELAKGGLLKETAAQAAEYVDGDPAAYTASLVYDSTKDPNGDVFASR